MRLPAEDLRKIAAEWRTARRIYAVYMEMGQQLGLKLKNDKKDLVTGGNLSGQTFLFTGTLPTLKRSDAEAMVESNGGKLLSSVSANLTYLVAGEEAGSKLEKAKKITSIKIITEAEFLSLIHH